MPIQVARGQILKPPLSGSFVLLPWQVPGSIWDVANGRSAGGTAEAPNGWGWDHASKTLSVSLNAEEGFSVVSDNYEYFHPPSSGIVTVYYYEFDVVCLTVVVSVSKVSSAPIAGTSPQQYKNIYSVSAVAEGGTAPITYSWLTSVGSFVPTPSSTDTTARLEVASTTPNFSGITGTVTCDVSDSDISPCTATDSADVADALAPPHPPCVPTQPNPPSGGGGQCSCDSNSCSAGAGPTGPADSASLPGWSMMSLPRSSAPPPSNVMTIERGTGAQCVEPTGNNAVASGGTNPKMHQNYGGGGGTSSGLAGANWMTIQ